MQSLEVLAVLPRSCFSESPANGGNSICRTLSPELERV
jgi:hypothetical protein